MRRFASDGPVGSLVDFVCIQLASSGASNPSGRWQLVSQHPPIKLTFASDGETSATLTLAIGHATPTRGP